MISAVQQNSQAVFDTIENNPKQCDMKWFVAKIIFRISSEGSKLDQFDEHLRLVAARDFEEAFLKARMLGIAGEDTVFTNRDTLVRWEFINVAELIPIQDLKDGSEIYSSIHETDEGSSYIKHVHRRAVFMQTAARPS